MYDTNESLAQAIVRNVRDALFEDIGRCDWTAQLVPAAQRVHARVIARETAILCGRPWFDACITTLDPTATITWHQQEGKQILPEAVICDIEADARALLSAERPALNFIQMLSANATTTRQYVDAIRGLSPNPKGCAILDTRKTLPGLRQAQKYAVRVGGGTNHRMALWDGILIKENHIAAAGGVAAAWKAAVALNAGVAIQIEVENLDELHQALEAHADNILLDNFTLPDMRKAFVATAGRATLEVSGGVDLQTIREVAATGVDRISIGRLTKDVRAVDFSLRVTD